MAALGRLETRESVEAIYRLAEAQAWSGDADAAITEIPAHAPILESRMSPFFVSLHDDPRWDAWLASLPLQDIYTPPDRVTDRRLAQEGH